MLPVLMVPGLLCSPEIWAPQQSALWPHTSVQIASTLSGTTVERIAADILDAAPPRFHLAGISLGGYLCFEILRQAPDRVDRLALLDTSARPDTAEQTAGRREMLAAARADYHGTATAGLMAVVHPDRRDDAELARINDRMARAVGSAGFASQTAAAIARPDSRPHLGDIRCPTLVMVGDADALTPPALSEEIVAGIPDARLVVIPDSGHASTIERPEVVNAALVAWMTSPSS